MAGRQKRILGNGTMSAPSKGESKTGNKIAMSSSKLPNQMDEWQEGRPGGTYGNSNRSQRIYKQEQLDSQRRMNESSREPQRIADASKRRAEFQGGEVSNASPRPRRTVGNGTMSTPQRKTQISSQKIEPKRTNVKTSVSMSERRMGPSDEQVAASRREGQKRAEEEARKRRQQYENAFGSGRRR